MYTHLTRCLPRTERVMLVDETPLQAPRDCRRPHDTRRISPSSTPLPHRCSRPSLVAKKTGAAPSGTPAVRTWAVRNAPTLGSATTGSELSGQPTATTATSVVAVPAPSPRPRSLHLMCTSCGGAPHVVVPSCAAKALPPGEGAARQARARRPIATTSQPASIAKAERKGTALVKATCGPVRGRRTEGEGEGEGER